VRNVVSIDHYEFDDLGFQNR